MDALFPLWFETISRAASTDTVDWGLAGRYEKKSQRLPGYEQGLEDRVVVALKDASFECRDTAYVGTRSHADGKVAHPSKANRELRYELKAIFIPHFDGPKHSHNGDYEKFLRFEHKNGALHDLERLRGSSETERAFLLFALSWCDETTSAHLEEYERHRSVLVRAFMELGKLPEPKARREIRGVTKPWSCDLMAWSL
jgi:hypothetical protein